MALCPFALVSLRSGLERWITFRYSSFLLASGPKTWITFRYPSFLPAFGLNTWITFCYSSFLLAFAPNLAGAPQKNTKNPRISPRAHNYLITCTPFFSTCSNLTSLFFTATFAEVTNAAAFSGWIIVRIVVPAPLK